MINVLPGPSCRSLIRLTQIAVAVSLASVVSLPARAQVFDDSENWYDSVGDWFSELPDVDLDDFTFRVGAGVGVVPDYSGSNQYETAAVPLFQVRYKDLAWLDPFGLRVKIWSNDCCRLLVRAGLATGRSPDKDSRIYHLPNVSRGMNLGFTYEGTLAEFLAFRLQAQQEVAGGHSGLTLTGSVGSVIRGERYRIVPELAVEWNDNDYMDAFYGVPVSASAASGYAPYDPGSGLEEVSVRLTSFYEVDEHWQLAMRTKLGLLVGDAKNAPFVRQDGDSFQALIGFGVLYQF